MEDIESVTVSFSKRNEDKESILIWSHVFVQAPKPRTFLNRLCNTPQKSDRFLLNDLSGVARPGQILAVMGTSGVGKTTLLRVLSGQNDSRSTTGDIYVDDHIITQAQRLTGNIIGHVEQHELFIETMSLEEHLIFQAMLRMERSINDDQRRAQVENIVSLLSLDTCRKTMIGRLSGGERKRLAFATVLLTDPSIVLIDEPTSGLDSYLAKELMKLIRSLAVQRRRTIVVVLHQPTSEMFSLIDSVCLLVHGGRLAFFGLKHEAERFFTSECGLMMSSLDHAIELLAAPPNRGEESVHCGSRVADQFVQSSRMKALFDDISSLQQPLVDESSYSRREDEWRSSFYRQFKWLLWRTLVAQRRNPLRNTKLILGLTIVAMIIGVSFYQLQWFDIDFEQNINAVLFFMLLGLVDTNMSLLLFSIPAERPLVIREYRRNTYSFTVYYLTRLISDTCTILITSIIYVTIIVLLVGIRHGATIVFIVTVEVFAACALASLICSFATSPQMALLVLQPIQISLAQFSGYFINLNSLPSYIKWLQYLSHYHYAYSLLLTVEWRDISCAFVTANDSNICLRSGLDILNYFGIDSSHFVRNFVLMFLMAIVCHVVAFSVTAIRIRRTV